MKKVEKRNTILLTIITIVTILVAIAGATFAYFSKTVEKEGTIKVDINTSDNASIYYEAGEELNLFAQQPGASGEVMFSVTLKGENSSGVNSSYNINWNIDSNSFVYEPNDQTIDPELVYNIYKSDDKKNWIPVVMNQDCTTSNGVVNLVNNQKIEVASNKTVTQYWKIVLVFQNLGKDQNYNQNKSLSSNITISNV